MSIDPAALATADLILQLLLVIVLVTAAVLARKKRFAIHCAIVRTAVILQAVAIAVAMLPSMGANLRAGQPDSLFNIEVLAHHSLGLAVIAIWIYVNLVMLGVIKMRRRLVWPMRLAFTCWLLALIMGIHIYVLTRA